MWAQKAPARMSRRPVPLPSLFLFDKQAMCVRKESGGERYLFSGEGVLRYAVRKVSVPDCSPLVPFPEKNFQTPQVWFPSM